jgi:hypothetical protein
MGRDSVRGLPVVTIRVHATQFFFGGDEVLLKRLPLGD